MTIHFVFGLLLAGASHFKWSFKERNWKLNCGTNNIDHAHCGHVERNGKQFSHGTHAIYYLATTQNDTRNQFYMALLAVCNGSYSPMVSKATITNTFRAKTSALLAGGVHILKACMDPPRGCLGLFICRQFIAVIGIYLFGDLCDLDTRKAVVVIYLAQCGQPRGALVGHIVDNGPSVTNVTATSECGDGVGGVGSDGDGDDDGDEAGSYEKCISIDASNNPLHGTQT